MANETPDFLRARNATDIASQVSDCSMSVFQKKQKQKHKKVAVIVRTQLFPSVILLVGQMHIMAWWNLFC